MRINFLLILTLTFITSFFINMPVFGILKLNEIYPAPLSGQDEWVELYNDEDKEIDISGYSLIDAANNKISLPATIESLSFISVTSSNVLNNSGDTLNLKNSSNEIIETVTYSGSFNAEKTYVRCPDGNGTWSTITTLTRSLPNPCPSLPNPSPAQEINLTPTITPIDITTTPTPSTLEAVLTAIVPSPSPPILISPTSTPTPITPTLSTAPITPMISYDNIYLSEAMVYPETGENEWVELFNNNDFSVELHNWFLDDISGGGSSPKNFSLDIQAKGYAVFSLSSAMFNNNGDTVRLLDFNNTIKDEFSYSNSEKGKTWGKINFNENSVCLQEPSADESNHSCQTNTEEAEQIIVTATLTPTPAPTVKSLTTQPQPSIKRIKPQINVPINTLQADTQIIPDKTHNGQRLVLGATTFNRSINYPLIKSLSFSSFSFALLAIGSIVYKCFFNIVL